MSVFVTKINRLNSWKIGSRVTQCPTAGVANGFGAKRSCWDIETKYYNLTKRTT